MIHWTWLIVAFMAGLALSLAAWVCLACCVVAKMADEEEHDFFEYYEDKTL